MTEKKNEEFTKGTEYYSNSEIEYQGEYFCYKRHGKGKEFDKKGRLIFKGWYMYGKYWSGKKSNTIKMVI